MEIDSRVLQAFWQGRAAQPLCKELLEFSKYTFRFPTLLLVNIPNDVILTLTSGST